MFFVSVNSSFAKGKHNDPVLCDVMDPFIYGSIFILLMVWRPRFAYHELKAIMKAAYFKLSADLGTGKLTEDSEHLFRILWRYYKKTTGRPHYPDFNESEIVGMLYNLMPELDDSFEG